MKILCVLIWGCWALGCVACGDNSAPGGGAGGNVGQAGTSSASGAGGGAGQAGMSASSAGTSQAGTGGASGASDYCNMYCQCHQANCASSVIPGGAACLDFCAAFPDDAKLRECRLGMCSLVPAQPNNDHCAHSLGIGECLAP